MRKGCKHITCRTTLSLRFYQWNLSTSFRAKTLTNSLPIFLLQKSILRLAFYCHQFYFHYQIFLHSPPFRLYTIFIFIDIFSSTFSFFFINFKDVILKANVYKSSGNIEIDLLLTIFTAFLLQFRIIWPGIYWCGVCVCVCEGEKEIFYGSGLSDQ